jgi:hypothetical protein
MVADADFLWSRFWSDLAVVLFGAGGLATVLIRWLQLRTRVKVKRVEAEGAATVEGHSADLRYQESRARIEADDTKRALEAFTELYNLQGQRIVKLEAHLDEERLKCRECLIREAALKEQLAKQQGTSPEKEP